MLARSEKPDFTGEPGIDMEYRNFEQLFHDEEKERQVGSRRIILLAKASMRGLLANDEKGNRRQQILEDVTTAVEICLGIELKLKKFAPIVLPVKKNGMQKARNAI